MRKALLFLLTIVCLAGCTDRHVREQLDRAERVVSDCPDSAFAILAALPDTDRLSTADRARRDLLMAEARYMADSTDTAPARLLETAAYFDLNNDPRNAARAYYYAGMQYRNKEDSWNAIISFLKADKLSKDNSDLIFQGLLCRATAESFISMMDYASALHYYNMAYSKFKQAPPNKYTIYALYDKARGLYAIGKYKDVLLHSREVISQARTKDNPELEYSALSLIGDTYYMTGNYKASIKTYETLLSKFGEYAEAEDYRALGNAYLKNGDLANAIRMDNTVREINPADASLHAFILRHTGRPEEAFDSLTYLIDQEKDYILQLWDRNNGKLIYDYYAVEDMKSTDKYLNERNRSYMLMIIIGLCLIICVYLIYHLFVQRQELNKQHLVYIENLMKQLKQCEKDITVLQKENQDIKATNSLLQDISSSQKQKEEETISIIKRMMVSQFNVLDSVYTGLNCDQNKEKITIAALSRFIESFLEPENITELESIVNRYMDNLMAKYHTDFPKIGTSQKQLFLFYAMNLTPQMISVLFKTNVSSLYVRKAKLKRKISESSSTFKDEYLRYLK